MIPNQGAAAYKGAVMVPPNFEFGVQAALVIRGGYVPQKYREYQNREYQVLKWPKNRGSVPKF